MPKPRILIAIHYLEIGGVETSLISLLDAWDYEKADIDLFVYSHRGEMMAHIPPQVTLLPEIKSYSLIESPIVRTIRNMRLGIAFGRYMARRRHQSFLKHNPQTTGDSIYGYIGRHVTPWLPDINPSVTYNLAISFLTPHDIVLRKVKARKKICWIHTDYSSIGHDARLEHPVWAAYDHIASISPAVTKGFLSHHPSLSDKIIGINNILSPTLIRTRADEFIPSEMDRGSFTILSVGRLSQQKNFENIPAITSSIISITGLTDLRWYIVGYGGMEQEIRDAIDAAGMQDHVILLGKRENPYPYIKHCDLYVQPSRYEGRSVTVREAQILGRPVVVTAYPTSYDQIDHLADGVIVPLDNDGCASGIASVISDKALLESLSSTCLSRDYSDSREVEKIYRLL